MRSQLSCHLRQFPFAPCFDSFNVSTNGSRQRFRWGCKVSGVSRFLSSVRGNLLERSSFMGASSNLGSNLTSEVKSRAGWGIFLGIVTAALGVLLIMYPLFAATVTTIFIGCILV